MSMHGAPLRVAEITPYGIVDLELAGTPDRVTAILNAWGPGLIKRAVVNTRIDFIFLTCYGLFLFGVVQATARWFAGRWAKAGIWLSRAMIIAALFDAIENILMLKMLNGSLGKELVASTYMFASVKFLLLLVGITYILFSILARLFSRNKATATTIIDQL